MNKQAYEHTVGLVLSKEAGFWDNVGGAFKDTWGDIQNAWGNASDDTKRNLISAGATGLLGAILGGAFGGGKGALLGGLGAGLAGWAGSKHVYPWMYKWYDHYKIHRDNSEYMNEVTNDTDTNPQVGIAKTIENNKVQPIVPAGQPTEDYEDPENDPLGNKGM